jgi:hypothetical protein
MVHAVFNVIHLEQLIESDLGMFDCSIHHNFQVIEILQNINKIYNDNSLRQEKFYEYEWRVKNKSIKK